MCSGNLSKAIEKAFLPELFYRSGIRSQDLYFQIRAQPISHCVSISLFWQYKWKNIQCHIISTACSGPNSKQWLQSEDEDTYDSTHTSIFWIVPQYFPRKLFMRHHMQVLALFSTLSTKSNVCLGDHMARRHWAPQRKDCRAFAQTLWLLQPKQDTISQNPAALVSGFSLCEQANHANLIQGYLCYETCLVFF